MPTLGKLGRTEYRRYRLGDGSSLLVRLDGRRPHIVPDEWADVIGECAGFRTIDDHVARIACLMGSRGRWTHAGASALRDLLVKLAELGLFVTAEDASRPHLVRDASSAEDLRVASLGVVTRDRPDALRRCLVSYARNFREHGRQAELLVLDDSDSPETCARNRSVAAAVGREFGLPTVYGGPREKADFADALQSRGGRADAVRFALLPADRAVGTWGANRNALQLATVGQLTVSVDDDTVCYLVAHPEASNQVRVAADADALECTFFPDRETALQSVAAAPRDFLALHEALLGKSLAEAAVSLGEVDLESVAALGSGGPPRDVVVATSLGILGDSATGSADFVLHLRGASRERLLASRAQYRTATTSRELLAVVRGPTLQRGGGWKGLCMGMDNRGLLPPFVPVCRGEDGTFASAALRCRPGAYLGHMPFAVLHAPPEPRGQASADVPRGAGRVRLYDLLESYLLDAVPTAAADGSWLRDVGAEMVHLGSRPLPAFQAHLRNACWRVYGRRASRLELQLEHSLASVWRRDIESAILHIRETVTRPDFPTAEDVAPGRSTLVRQQAAQWLFRQVGGLYLEWPDIRDAAQDLRRLGMHPFARVDV